jgi:hypothetical protein
MQALVRFFFVLLLASGSSQLAAAQGDDPSAGKKECHEVRGEARYRALGYNHVVIVTNRCKEAISCKVWTDVDPSPRQSLEVAANSSAEITTRLGSPASSFSAYAECK